MRTKLRLDPWIRLNKTNKISSKIFTFSCPAGNGNAGINGGGSSGAGHGGNGGTGQNQPRVGIAYGHVFEPQHFGCQGGGNGGLGGGVIKMKVGGKLKIDGSIIASGAAGQQSFSGGGSGGSVWIETNLIQGYGLVQANGGDGFRDTRYLELAHLFVFNFLQY